jgi:hypothetical protein
VRVEVLLLLPLLVGCATKKPLITKVIIPKACITSDLQCVNNGKEMRCKLDKFKGCEIIAPAISGRGRRHE